MRWFAALLVALAAVSPAKAAAPLLQPCVIDGTRALCGTVVVPEDRATPGARSVSLRVAVLPAASTPVRPDPVFFVTGGPGGVDYDLVPVVAELLGPVNEHRDIVFVDQRGVGGSNPLTCTLPGVGYTGTIVDFVTGCVGATSRDLTHYRTVDAADDLEDVRIALGYGKIDLLGGSYGATFVQVFLNRHPESVRAAVMDGATLLDVPVFELWASSAQRALDLLHGRCHAERECAAAFPSWYEKFPAMLQLLSRHPVDVQVGKARVPVDAAKTADVVEDMTTNVYGAARVPYTLAAAERGRLAPLAREILARLSSTDKELSLMPLAIECTEPWSAADPARAWADAKSTYMRYSYPAQVVFQVKLCGAWPKVDTTGENWQRPHTTLPVLDLVGGADPKDPPRNVAGLEAAMPNSKVVVVPGQGHGTTFTGCIPHVIDHFLEAGSPVGLDTSCVSLIETPRFFLG